jgi:cytochrome c553
LNTQSDLFVRYDQAITSLAGTFSEDEKVLLELYWSQMELKPAEITDKEQWARGKKIFEIACTQCHGKNGCGGKGYARLAGQQATYVTRMLMEFRSYTGRRFNPWVTAVTTSLTDDEIADVASYISTMTGYRYECGESNYLS